MKDQALRKKLQDLGIPNWGLRQLLIRRHVEWVNIWNANCDSDRPRSKRELLRDLDGWEHSQGGHAKESSAGPANGVMAKDFDSRAYASSNKDDFGRLIEQARRKARVAAATAATAGAPGSEQDTTTSKDQKKGNGAASIAPQDDHDHDNNQQGAQDRQVTHPYADNDEALLSIRHKVEAANRGEHIEPLQNRDFRPPDEAPDTTLTTSSNTTTTSSSAKPAQPIAPTQNQALMSQAHFGLRHNRNGSHGSNHGRGSEAEPCNLSEHLASPPVKRVPMFRVPEEPVVDVDGGPMGH